MKKSYYSFGAFVLTTTVTLILITSTSFINQKSANKNFTQNFAPTTERGIVVEVVKDRGWLLRACGELILAQSSTEVFLDDTRVIITNIWKLPKGHCLIPERGAAFYPNLIVTPNGMAKGKAIVHPNEL